MIKKKCNKRNDKYLKGMNKIFKILKYLFLYVHIFKKKRNIYYKWSREFTLIGETFILTQVFCICNFKSQCCNVNFTIL